ncbi:FG-GAP repeat domain-containing protein [Streptomyces sp. 8N114]|uniref:FG-GAP repeat domain-containing protein n=1 Tax=Streptomyces sp. 8N114 TaxID=3457419 RepID=UPI003FCF1681
MMLVLTGCSGTGTPSDDRADSPRPPAGKAADSGDDPDSGDFNGDGYDDYAAVVTSDIKGKDLDKNTLLVVYGSKNGLNRSWTTRADGETEYPPQRTDLNGDGFTDLVGERSRGAKKQTFAMFGGPRGLTGPRALDVPRGFHLMTVGDFDGDGKTDLFDAGRGGRGDPNSDPAAGNASARILYGPVAPAGKQPREHPRKPVPLDLGQDGYASPEDAAVGDFDADGRTDLVLTYEYDAEQDDSAPDDLTPVAYYRGAKRGLARDRSVEPALNKILASDEEGPNSPSVGDADGDGIDDLLLPLFPPASYGGRTVGEDGGVGVLHGARSGLGTGTGTGTGKRDLRIIEGPNPSMGYSPVVGEVNGDDHPDMVVNNPEFHRTHGLVTLLPGGPDGPSAKGAQEIDARTKGLPGPPAPDRWNDFSVEAPLLDTNGDGHDDAFAFVPLRTARKGAFLEIPGTKKGFAPDRARQFTPSDVDVPPAFAVTPAG